MTQKLLSFLFILRRFFLLRLYRAYVTTHTECKGLPKIKGEVFLNAKGVKLGKNVTFYQGAYLWGGIFLLAIM